MLLKDIMAMIPADDLAEMKREAESLSKESSVDPVNRYGEKIDWLEVIVRDWWEKENTPPAGWFQWWDD